MATSIKTKPAPHRPGPWYADVVATELNSKVVLRLKFHYPQSRHISLRGVVWGVRVVGNGTATIIALAKLEQIPVEIRFMLQESHPIVGRVIAHADNKYINPPKGAIDHVRSERQSVGFATPSNTEYGISDPQWHIHALISGKVMGMDDPDPSRGSVRACPNLLVLDYATAVESDSIA